MTEWKDAVASGNAATLADLAIAAASSREEALEVLRRAANVVLSKISPPAMTPPQSASTAADTKSPSTATTSNGAAKTRASSESMCTLRGVQLLQPRGRFDLEFSQVGVNISGKAGAVEVSWENVRHIIRLPRPEGYSWGKTDSSDPAGSDLLAIPLKQSVPFRKNTIALLLMQPDPKAKHEEFSFEVEGVSHSVSGSQGTIISELLKILSRVRQNAPDKSLFVTREGKSFVKCYHGVNEGSLFPLKQGLLFMKPGLFLPQEDIEEVVCGRGGSAQTRYVDLLVGMETLSNDGEEEEDDDKDRRQEEFSNIPRDYLASLQHYIQNALVAPRQREAKRAERAQKQLKQKASDKQQQQQQQQQAEAGGTASAQGGTSSREPTEAVMVNGESDQDASTVISGQTDADGARRAGAKGEQATSSDVVGVRRAAPARTARKVDDDLDADGDVDLDSDESDEDFAPPDGDSSSGDESGDSVASVSDDNESEASYDDDDNEEEDEEHYVTKRRRENSDGSADDEEVSMTEKGVAEGGDGDGDDTESESEAESRPRKRAK